MQTTPLTVLILIGLTTLTGCKEVSESAESGANSVITGHRGGAYVPRNATRYDLENRERFVLLDKAAERSVTCSGMQERLLEDGRIEVVANLRNRLKRRIQVQVNCVFKDDQGFPTGDETSFADVILTEKAQEGVRFISMNNKAKRYTIRVRQAR